jgi:ABC-type antimicrobial peptide transport system permease subunit
MSLMLSYTMRNLWARKLTTLFTAGGMALVSFVFAAVLMLAEGLERTLMETGSSDNAIVLRASADAEVSSIISKDDAAIVEVQPEISRNPEGEALSAKEMVVLVALPKESSGKVAHVLVRGVSQRSMSLRRRVALAAGRTIEPGRHEVLAGKSIAQRIENASLGGILRFALSDWKVVGVLEAEGTGFESELWADVDQLMSAFRRREYSDVILKIPDEMSFRNVKQRLESDPRLSVQVKREVDFYRAQSEIMATFIRVLGTAMTAFFSVGAVLGAMVTMYTAVAYRTREIGALRALGFRKSAILGAFVGESLLLGVIGGGAGIAAGSLLQLVTISTLNWETFSELAFGFELTLRIGLMTIGFAAAMGLIGGLLPAWSAARLPIVEALRAV